MALHASPHCPACAAPLPTLERQQIVTCDFCGTDVNADYQPAPAPPPRSPPLSPDRTFSLEDEDPSDWESGAYVHALLTAANPDAAVALARAGNGYLAGEDLLLWAPALAQGIIDAEAAGHATLADEIALLVRFGGSWRKYHSNPDESPSAAAEREGRRLAPADVDPAQRVEPKHSWTYLQTAQRVLHDAPACPGGMILLLAAGPAALRRLLELAADAERAGDDARLTDALACAHHIITQTTDDWDFGVVFDIATYLLPSLPTRTQQGVIDSLADLADLAIDEEGREYGRDWRGPSDTLTVLLLYADDLLHEHPDLARRFLDAVVQGADRHPFERYRWMLALAAIPTPEGRAAVLDAYEKVYKQRAEEHEEELLDEVRRKPGTRELQPFLTGDLPPAVRVATARDGQAPCPSCGRALTLDPTRLIITCDHCGQASRVAREVRTVRRVLDPESLELHTWTPDRLVSTMLETEDDALRTAIATELASATSDGSRYVELAPALVAYMLADNIPQEIERLLAAGVESMLRFRDPDFLDALFLAIRQRAFTEDGSVRLLRALEKAGPPAAPLLFDLCDQVTASADDWSRYTLSAKQSAQVVIQHWADKDLDAAADFLLRRMEASGPAIADSLPTTLGVHAFDEKPCGPLQERLVRFIDNHTDPDKVEWHKGVSPLGPDLPVPFLSWTAQDVADAEERLGLKWAKGGPLDTQKIIAAIPAIPGSVVTLRQVSLLISQLECRWGVPASTDDLLARLQLAADVLHDNVRVSILLNLTAPPGDLDDDDRTRAFDLLASMPASPNLDPWRAMVTRCLSATPGRDTADIARREADD